VAAVSPISILRIIRFLQFGLDALET